MQKNLYVVKFRGSDWAGRRELSNFERLAGWRDSDYEGKPLVVYKADGSKPEAIVNEGHGRGSLHSLSAPHVLTWSPKAGDSIVAALAVQFWSDGAHCDVDLYADHRVYKIECRSLLGRAVMLGEDGAEDAFGHDELHRQIAAAVVENDWRDALCECVLTEINPDDPYPAPCHVPAPGRVEASE